MRFIRASIYAVATGKGSPVAFFFACSLSNASFGVNLTNMSRSFSSSVFVFVPNAANVPVRGPLFSAMGAGAAGTEGRELSSEGVSPVAGALVAGRNPPVRRNVGPVAGVPAGLSVGFGGKALRAFNIVNPCCASARLMMFSASFNLQLVQRPRPRRTMRAACCATLFSNTNFSASVIGTAAGGFGPDFTLPSTCSGGRCIN